MRGVYPLKFLQNRIFRPKEESKRKRRMEGIHKGDQEKHRERVWERHWRRIRGLASWLAKAKGITHVKGINQTPTWIELTRDYGWNREI